MKKSFLRQLSEYSENITDETADSDKIFAIVHNQTDGFYTPVRKARVRFPVALAAIIGMAVLAGTAAAYYASVNDAFSGVLRENTPDGGTAPISSDSPLAPVVDKSGTVVGESVVVEGVEVTVRGVVGAGSELKILVDIEDLSGKPLALFNDDGTLSDNQLTFGMTKIRTAETLGKNPIFLRHGNYDIYLTPYVEPEISDDFAGFIPFSGSVYYMWSEFIKNDEPSKASILLEITLDNESINDYLGETLYLTLTDIIQVIKADGSDTGADLYNIANAFDGLAPELRKNGYREDENKNIIWHYELAKDSGKEIPLTAQSDDYSVTNATIKDGILYLRGKALNIPPAPSADDVTVATFGGVWGNTPNFTLYNTVTGEYLSPEGCGSGDGEEDHIFRWYCTFAGINSAEELKDYILLEDYGALPKTLTAGEWNFEIPLDFGDTTKTYAPEQKFNLGDFELTAKEIVISPYYISISAEADEENLEKMSVIQEPVYYDAQVSENVTHTMTSGLDDWSRFLMEENPKLTVVMKDGSKIKVINKGGTRGSEIYFNFMPDVVIDPGQIDYITFGNLNFTVD